MGATSFPGSLISADQGRQRRETLGTRLPRKLGPRAKKKSESKELRVVIAY